MFRIYIVGFVTGFVSFTAGAKQLVSESDAVNKALLHNKNIQAASLQVKQQQQLLKSFLNLPNPEFFWVGPTGNFYTGSITQSFEFPTVYSHQYRCHYNRLVSPRKKNKLHRQT